MLSPISTDSGEQGEREREEEGKPVGKILWALRIKMCLTSVVCRTVFIVPHQTAGMLRGRGVVVLVWLVPCVGPLVARVHLAVGAVALRRNLAQRQHLQPVLLARRHAMH